MSQKDIFFKFEGDNWYKRKKDYLLNSNPDNDFILKLIDMYKIEPKKVLEIGCSNGYRLNFINKKYNSSCIGVDPSKQAVEEGTKLYKNIKLVRGVFSDIPLEGLFDLIIINFVFHWIDRKLIAKCVSEVERLLLLGGFLLIGDFSPDNPRKNKYHHLPDENLWTFKQDYTKLFLSLNKYSLITYMTTGHNVNDFVIE